MNTIIDKYSPIDILVEILSFLAIINGLIILAGLNFNSPQEVYQVVSYFWSSHVELIISLSAFIVALYSAFTTRQHNIISSRPLLTIHSDLSKAPFISINLTNAGVGPAIIKKVNLLRDNEDITYSKLLKENALLFDQASNFKLQNLIKDFTSRNFGDYSILSSQEKVCIFECTLIDFDRHIGIFRSEFQKFNVIIEFIDVYNRRHIFNDFIVNPPLELNIKVKDPKNE